MLEFIPNGEVGMKTGAIKRNSDSSTGLREVSRASSEESDVASVTTEKPQGAFDRCRFARSVQPDETVNRTGWNREIDAVPRIEAVLISVLGTPGSHYIH